MIPALKRGRRRGGAAKAARSEPWPITIGSALAKHNGEQEESRWPWEATTAINVDRDLAQPDQPEDEFAYLFN